MKENEKHITKLAKECMSLVNVDSTLAFSQILDLPYSTVRSWFKGRGSKVSENYLSLYIDTIKRKKAVPTKKTVITIVGNMDIVEVSDE
jgi:hypothetical protein